MNYSMEIKEPTIKDKIERLRKSALDSQLDNLMKHIEHYLQYYHTDFSDTDSWYRINRKRINENSQKEFLETIKTDEERAKEFLYSKGYLLKGSIEGNYDIFIREDVNPFSFITKLDKLLNEKLIADLYRNPKTTLHLGMGDNRLHIIRYIEEQGLSCQLYSHKGIIEVKYE